MKTEQLQQIEALVKSETATPASITHAFDHMKRVAEGAAWFVRVSGGSKDEQLLARAAGLLHDIIRPPHDKIDHVLASTSRAEEILKKLNISDADRRATLQAVRDHGGVPIWSSPLHESVFFADKIFEQAGAFVEFRRTMWISECKDIDWAKTTLRDVTIDRYTERLKVVRPERFNPKFAKVVQYQLKWLMDFLQAFKDNRPWASRINKAGFEAGKKRMHVEEFIRNYKPAYTEDLNYKEEAIEYIEGKLWEKFEKMLK